MNRGRHWVCLPIVLCISLFVLGCELDETLAINADGSGTYVLRIAMEKQLGGFIPEMKKDAEKRAYRIVEETETADRKVLVMRRDFHDVTELNDSNDTYVLRIDRSHRWKPAFSLTVSSHASPVTNGVLKRTMTVRMPAGVTSASAGAVHGRRVEWDASSGGTLQVEAAGLAWPFGMPPLAIAIVIVALLGLGVAAAARRRAMTFVPKPGALE